MESLFEELMRKIERNPGMNEGRGPRQDLGVMLFSQREAIGALWKAADRLLAADRVEDLSELREAADKLRPLFGERPIR